MTRPCRRATRPIRLRAGGAGGRRVPPPRRRPPSSMQQVRRARSSARDFPVQRVELVEVACEAEARRGRTASGLAHALPQLRPAIVASTLPRALPHREAVRGSLRLHRSPLPTLLRNQSPRRARRRPSLRARPLEVPHRGWAADRRGIPEAAAPPRVTAPSRRAARAPRVRHRRPHGGSAAARWARRRRPSDRFRRS